MPQQRQRQLQCRLWPLAVRHPRRAQFWAFWLPVEGERDFEMEAELKLLFVAVGRCCERLIFAETKDSKASSDMFRWLQHEDLAVEYREEDHADHGDVRVHQFKNLTELASGLDDCTAVERARRLKEMAKLCRVAGYTDLKKRAMAQMRAETTCVVWQSSYKQ